MMEWQWSFFFFFQAEDGIRDLTVTGVQTCALPISRARVLQLAESHDLLVVGASDNHGWGQVTCVWNLSSPSAHGYRSNRVIARPIALAQGEWQPWTAAYTQPWLMLAGLSWSERSSWITWILVILIYRAVPRRAGDPA